MKTESNTTTLETERLTLIACDTHILETALKGNEALAEYLNCQVPDNWTEFGNPALEYSLARLAASEAEAGWWTYLPKHKATNTLIGSGGYKGQPTKEGIAELGYEIAPGFRNKGLATDFTRALVKNAFSSGRVTTILAHTLGEDNASTRVLNKCGFAKTAEFNDPDDGLIWRWELHKPQG